MIEMVPLEPWHLELLHSEGHIEESVYSAGYASYICNNSKSVAAFDSGVLVAAGGVIHLWNGVGDGWSVIVPEFRKKPVALVKVFKKFFQESCPEYKRVQITVDEKFEEAQAFAEYLGFTPEGRMEYYSPTGETHIRYARIR